ncbi:MAG: flagellin [Bryobacteraceae bacterium]
MISLQTNINSLDAQNSLNTDNLAQGKTIQQLSSGYRINSSGDDAAGLAVANQYRDNIAELTQGVSNASTGIAQLQIVDGGLSNISTIMDRMKTLATESASGTFTGDRNTLDQEYQGLISEITRQATNVNLNSGGTFNSALNVYIGGASNLTNASVSIDLSGSSNAVDASSLGLSGTDVKGGTVGGVGFTGNIVRLDNPATTFLAAGTQTYTFNYADSGGNTQARNVVLSGGSSGVDGNAVISQLNSGLTGTGITASINASNGTVQFTSSSAFTAGVAAATAGTSTVTAAATAVNTSQYNLTSAFAAVVGTSESFTISDGKNTAAVTLASTVTTVSGAVSAINAALKSASITDVSALANGDGTGISIQGASNFSVTQYAAAGTSGGLFAGTGSESVTAATSGGAAGTDASAAITAINKAIQNLGLVQGRVGAGQNLLQYATNLANSQITNFSTAQSDIRDANVAADASQLTQGQVLEQTAVAAMAQANSSAQVVLKLLP